MRLLSRFPPLIRRADVDVHCGLEAAGDAAVVQRKLALFPYGRPRREQVVSTWIHPIVDQGKSFA
jgi:hypothetical protein